MKFVSALSDEETYQLKDVLLHHSSSRTRLRASIILLSSARVPLQKIAEAFLLTRQTVSDWIDEWEKTRNPALEDLPRSGAPSILSSEEKICSSKLLRKNLETRKKFFID